MAKPRKDFKLNDKQRELIEDNILLFYKCFHKLREKYDSLSDDEVWDCCTEAAVKVAHSLDEKKGKYSTLLYIAAERNVLKRIRYYDFESRKGSKSNMSLDYEYGEDNEKGDQFANRYLGVNDNYDFINIESVLSVLNEREKEVVYRLVILDLEKQEIAKELGISPQSVSYSLNTAAKRVRKAFEL